MKPNNVVLLFCIISVIYAACTSQNKIVFHPETEPELPAQQSAELSWQILESKNGPAGALLPEWVSRFLSGGVRGIERLHPGYYVFIGANQGTNFTVLRQWADGYTAAQDLPRLVSRRVEQRLIAAASLYPDDEYGDYFAALIRDVSNAEYPGAEKEESFWIKRRIAVDSETEFGGAETPQAGAVEERYEFLVLISIDRAALQSRIRELMANVKTAVPPTREQAAAISRIQHAFFEGF